MSFKFIFIFLADLIFPLLQVGPDPGGGGNKAPITGGIIYLLLAAIGIGIKAFSKMKKN